MDDCIGKKDPKISLQDVGNPPEAAKQLGDELGEELPATRTPDLTGLPNMSEVGKGYDEIFGMIEAGNHIEVEKFLAKRGQKVEIKPKIGCSPIHYTKFNVCNFENANQDTPLITAAKVNTRMVEIVLQYGGNPNHVNKDGDTPISIAANRCDKDSIDALLWAGGNLTAAVIKLTSTLRYVTEKQLKESAQAGFSVKPLIVLLADDVYLKCRDPIRAAFDVYKEIKHIKHVRDEFRIEFESLMEASDLFVYKFLNHCDEMAEAREILQLNSSRNLLKTAIDRRKKQFVSHPFSQQIIHEQWYGETANRLFWGKLSIALKYLTSIVVLPLTFLKFLLIDVCRGVSFMESSCSDLMRFLSIPCLCFATDAINYIGFLVVLISTCLSHFGEKTYEVTTIEYVLYYSVFARIFIEADLLIQQGWRSYFRKFWNGMNIVVLGLLVAGAVMKATIQYVIDKQADNYAKELNVENSTEESLYTALEAILINQHRKSMNVNYMYAVAEFILVIRLMSLLEIVKSLGPMLIALKYLLIDVIKFSVILLMVIMGTSISLYSMTIALNEWNEELNYIRSNITWPKDYPKDLPVAIKIPKVFDTFTDTIRNVLWGTFGLLDIAVSHLICKLELSQRQISQGR